MLHNPDSSWKLLLFIYFMKLICTSEHSSRTLSTLHWPEFILNNIELYSIHFYTPLLISVELLFRCKYSMKNSIKFPWVFAAELVCSYWPLSSFFPLVRNMQHCAEAPVEGRSVCVCVCLCLELQSFICPEAYGWRDSQICVCSDPELCAQTLTAAWRRCLPALDFVPEAILSVWMHADGERNDRSE